MYSVMLFQKRTKFCVLIGVLIFGGLSLAHAQAPTPLPIPSLENTDSSDPSGEQDLERKCASGDMKACHTLLAFVEQGCNRNDARACYTLGIMKRQGLGTHAELGGALRSLEKGCELKSKGACEYLARLFSDVLATQRGELDAQTRSSLVNRYLRFLELACELQSTRACAQRGQVAREGKLHSADLSKARTYFRRACLLNDDSGCRGFGVTYETNLWTVNFDADAIDVLRRACTANMPTACIYLAHAYLQSSGVQQDDRRGTELFEKACALKSPWGCNNLADRLLNGKGIAPDPQRAVRLYRGACEQNDAMACSHLANLHRRGAHGVSKDTARAFVLQTKACDLNCPPCCADLAEMYRAGIGTAPNAGKAISLYEKACQSGDTFACKTLESNQNQQP